MNIASEYSHRIKVVIPFTLVACLLSIGSVISADKQPTAKQLKDAVRSGDLPAIKAIISRAPSLMNLPCEGYTPLHWAAADNHLKVAEFLLANGAEVNRHVRKYGTTPIFLANSAGMADLLVKSGADLNIKDPQSDSTPLGAAASSGNVAVVRVLINGGATLDFDSAVQLGWTTQVAKMLGAKPWLAKPPRTPLLAAAGSGNLEMVRLLLKYHADPNAAPAYMNVSGPYTALTAAVTSGHYDVMQLLFENGANPNVSGGRNHSNLFLYAIAYCDLRFTKAFLSHGADLHAGERWSSSRNTTPLHVVAATGASPRSGHIHRVGQPTPPTRARKQAVAKCKLLLQAGAEVSTKNSSGATPLHFAILADNDELIEFLLKGGSELDLAAACALGRTAEAGRMLERNPQLLNAAHPFHRSLLHWAARTDDVELVQRLLLHGAKLDARAPNIQYEDAGGFSARPGSKHDGETPLHVAARNGNTKVAKRLIEKGAQVGVSLIEDGRTTASPLELAIWHGHAETVKMLLRKGAYLNLRSLRSRSALIENTAVLKIVLDERPNIDLGGRLGQQFVGEAVSYESRDAIRLLEARGATPDIFSAVILGRVERVRKLIDRKPALAKARRSRDPADSILNLAVKHGHIEIAKLLDTRGVTINPKTNGPALIHLAVEWGQLSMTKFLISRGCEIDVPFATDPFGNGANSLLHTAAEGAQPHLIRFLLEHGADAAGTNRNGETPLHVVGGWRHIERPRQPDFDARIVASAKLLLEAGADVNARTHNGTTPLHQAARYDNSGLAALLLAAKADVNAQDDRGVTPTRLAHRRFLDPLERDGGPLIKLLRKYGGKRR